MLHYGRHLLGSTSRLWTQHRPIPASHRASLSTLRLSQQHPRLFQPRTQAALQVRHKAILATGILYTIMHGSRALMTALPVLWRWNFFKKYPRTMKAVTGFLALGLGTVVVLHIELHPMTHRLRLMFVDEATELQLAGEGFQQMLDENKGKILPVTHPWYIRTKKICDRLTSVVGKDLRDWELVMIDDAHTVNAMVLPNGKIFVYTGMILTVMASCMDNGTMTEEDSEFFRLGISEPNLMKKLALDVKHLTTRYKNYLTTGKLMDRPDTDFDQILAAVLAHEVSHVLSRHGAESIGIDNLIQIFVDSAHSMIYTATLNLPVLSDMAGRGIDAVAPFMTVLPHSRRNESEADVIGLFLMAAAGYDPSRAKEFWNFLAKMEALELGGTLTGADGEGEVAVEARAPMAAAYVAAVLEFVSTHPSHIHRSDELRRHEDAAMEVFKSHQRVRDEIAAKLAAGKGQAHADGEIDFTDRVISEVLSEHVATTGNALWYARK
ncbi:peptidase family M48-domain-containing protein, partial [Chytriomyces sp. MP71]